jgi:hypothetical protein
MLSYIVAYAKESGFGFIPGKLLQDPGSDFRDRPIIKSEKDDLFFCGHMPDKIGEKILN